MGRPLVRQAASSAAILASACGLLRSPQLGWSIARCTSITSSAAEWGRRILAIAPTPPTPAATCGFLRGIFRRERQRDVRGVLLLIHLQVRFGRSQPLEKRLFLDAIEEIIGILRVQRLAFAQGPDAQ